MRYTRSSRTIILHTACLLLGAYGLNAQDACTPGAIQREAPTLISLGFQWSISGDANENASVQVRYRPAGSKAWREFLPLARCGRGREVNYGFGNFADPAHQALRYRIPDSFTGSIFDLEPDTAYEVELILQDPDGVNGEARRLLQLRTRAEPQPFADGLVRHVYPNGYQGEREQPAYNSIMHAVNGFGPWCDCYQTVHPAAAEPGTIIKLHGGIYRSDRNNYREPNVLWQHGTHTLIADGEPDKPIAIVPAGDGEVIVDGAGCDVLFDVRWADHLYFEGLHIRDTRIAFHAGIQGTQGSIGLSVKGCRIDQVGYGVLAQDARSRDFYIADNLIIGRNDAGQIHGEAGRASGRSDAGYAVNLSGSGHVVCFNEVRQFWDGINVFTCAVADPALQQQARSIDIYNNVIANISDNLIESDGGYANIRILRNRGFDCYSAPLSIQPVYQGPVYWIRNVVYNAGSLAVKAAGGDNVFYYHNTSTSAYAAGGGNHYGDYRNNVFGGAADGRFTYRAGFAHAASRFDHNAHRRAGDRFQITLAERKITVGSLAELQEQSGLGDGDVLFDDYSVFQGAVEPDHMANKAPLSNSDSIDLGPATDSPLLDAGVRLPGINDDFTGDAPDLGAFERGVPPPHCGPRRPLPGPPRLRAPASDQTPPADPGRCILRVNCGALYPSIDPYGREWQRDQTWDQDRSWYVLSRFYHRATRRKPVENADLPLVYGSERYAPGGYRVACDNGRYRLRLHFVEHWHKTESKRVFSIQAEGRVIESELDVVAAAGGRYRALPREYDIQVSDGELSLDFVSMVDNPMVYGLELFALEP